MNSLFDNPFFYASIALIVGGTATPVLGGNCSNIFSGDKINTYATTCNAWTGSLYHNLKGLRAMVRCTMMLGCGKKFRVVWLFKISHQRRYELVGRQTTQASQLWWHNWIPQDQDKHHRTV